MNLRIRNLIFILAAFIGVSFIIFGLNPAFLNATNPTDQEPQIQGEKVSTIQDGMQSFLVTRIVDGDTIEIQTPEGLKKLRYIGIDTPETVDPRKGVQCYGKEAKAENEGLVGGKAIFVQKDVSETDKFGRLLRYVYVEIEDRNLLFVNDYLVRQGFAHAATFPPDVKYAEKFKQAQEEAIENSRGLWGKCGE